MAIGGNYDVAMIVWGIVWTLGGAGLIYGLFRAFAAEDREIRGAEREDSLARPDSDRRAQNLPKVGAA